MQSWNLWLTRKTLQALLPSPKQVWASDKPSPTSPARRLPSSTWPSDVLLTCVLLHPRGVCFLPQLESWLILPQTLFLLGVNPSSKELVRMPKERGDLAPAHKNVWSFYICLLINTGPFSRIWSQIPFCCNKQPGNKRIRERMYRPNCLSCQRLPSFTRIMKTTS